MASSGKFDLSSVSPDRPLYNTAQRGSYTAASLDRSSSFRENMENPILSSLPSMSRSTSTVTQVDVTNFLQCLRFDPKSMAAEHKFNRHGDFKRLASAVLSSPDESPSGSSKGKVTNSSPDDLKRLKAGLRESSIKARYVSCLLEVAKSVGRAGWVTGKKQGVSVYGLIHVRFMCSETIFFFKIFLIFLQILSG